ncbi:MAG TPA: DinB family protein [Gemmatimonadaceae bacterium]
MTDLAQLFIARSRYYLQHEYRTKLRLAVEALPADALWWRPNEQSNSVGNLLSHLAGNVRQWIVGGVGGAPNVRDRGAEFAAQTGPSAAELLARLERVLDETDAVLAGLSADDLGTMRTIQGRELTVFEAIYHVVEHFALHLGQIVLVAKMHAPGAVKFYEDAGGLARPVWQELESSARNR